MWWIIGSVIVLVVIGGAGYVLYQLLTIGAKIGDAYINSYSNKNKIGYEEIESAKGGRED